MAGVDSSEFDCPVGSDVFKIPKLLPCYHLVCRNCVLSWLQRTEGQGECPICRAPILPATTSSSSCKSPDQLEAQVDGLQTDLATKALAESHHILKGPHLCDMCQNCIAGEDFCLQCSIKLCSPCAQYHQKLPGTKDHSVQQIDTLTVSQLAGRYQAKCKTHPQQLADLYCALHAELVCCRCASTAHRGCPEVQEIKDVAGEQRRKLKDRLEKLKVKEDGDLAEKVGAVKEQSKSMRQEVESVFDDLALSILKRRDDVINLVQAEEDAMVALLTEVENARLSAALPCRNIENLVSYSPDDGLLEMLQQLISRLDKLESQLKVKDDIRDMGFLVLDGRIITRLKSDLDKLGHLQQPQPPPKFQPASTPAPRTAARIRATGSARSNRLDKGKFPRSEPIRVLLKVGDRVQLAPGIRYQVVPPEERGTVTAIPSRKMRRDGDPEGWVDVDWDTTGERCHCMGWQNRFELIPVVSPPL